MIKIIQDAYILRQKSVPVSSVGEAQEIINKLESVLAITPNSVGLAAIQIGIPKQVGVIKCNDTTFYLINPEVVEQKNEHIFIDEGCLSFPDIHIDTKRYKDFTFKCQQIIEGEFVEEIYYAYYSSDSTEMGNDGLQSIAIQHEIDHFNGKLIFDHHIVRNPVVVEKKIGRNDICPCGSGKKYKKCCRP